MSPVRYKRNRTFMFMLITSFLFFQCSEDTSDELPNDEERPVDAEALRISFQAEGEDPISLIATKWEGQNTNFFFPEGFPNEVEDLVLTNEVTYELNIELGNLSDLDSLNQTIAENKEDFQVFFAYQENIFEIPAASQGNIEEVGGDISYLDFDSNNLPVGLRSTWKPNINGGGIFNTPIRFVLIQLDEEKTPLTSIDDGTVIFDLSLDVDIFRSE
ncbi:MAG: hypothetical protein AAF391_04040 [Bacteroidota bacterium]